MAIIGDPQAPIGVQALKALGMREDRCTSLTIEFRPKSIVVARAEYATEEGEMEKVIKVLEGCR